MWAVVHSVGEGLWKEPRTFVRSRGQTPLRRPLRARYVSPCPEGQPTGEAEPELAQGPSRTEAVHPGAFVSAAFEHVSAALDALADVPVGRVCRGRGSPITVGE